MDHADTTIPGIQSRLNWSVENNAVLTGSAPARYINGTLGASPRRPSWGRKTSSRQAFHRYTRTGMRLTGSYQDAVLSPQRHVRAR